MISTLDIIARLTLTVILTGLIGSEREWSGRPAGLRTHILVGVGAALVMLVSMYGFAGTNDPARLAAQVVSGIGFLGAGAILRDKGDITGITTASTIWITAMIGLAVGNGFYFGAIFATAIVIFTLIGLRFIERYINHQTKTMTIIGDDTKPLMTKIVEICDRNELHMTHIEAKVIGYGKVDALRLTASLSPDVKDELIKIVVKEIEEQVKPYSITIK
jgi:putative Mg2+ transporter-C (MgtC) family protein